MNKSRIFVFGIFLWGTLILPLQAQAQVLVNEETYRAILIELIGALQKQIAVLQVELSRQQSSLTVLVADQTNGLSSQVDVVATYFLVKTGDISAVTNKSHRDYFRRVFELFPAKYDVKLSRLIVFDGEKSEYDAFVETIPPKHLSWLYAVNKEIIKDHNSAPNTELIIHELANIVSYEEIIGVQNPDQTNCEDYFYITDCPVKNYNQIQFLYLGFGTPIISS